MSESVVYLGHTIEARGMYQSSRYFCVVDGSELQSAPIRTRTGRRTCRTLTYGTAKAAIAAGRRCVRAIEHIAANGTPTNWDAPLPRELRVGDRSAEQRAELSLPQRLELAAQELMQRERGQ